MDYYVCIRNTIQKFEDLASKVVIEGGTLNLALLSLSGIFFRYSFRVAAIIVCLGSIVTTFCFGLMAWFYLRLLGISVETAKKMEDEIFPPAWNPSEEEEGKKLTYNLDQFCTIRKWRVAGKRTWIVVLLEFGIIFSLGLFLILVYLFYAPHLLPPTDC